MTTQTIAIPQASDLGTGVRCWFNADYRRAGKWLRESRTQTQSKARQAAVDGMAAVMAAMFQADSAEFSVHYFLGSVAH